MRARELTQHCQGQEDGINMADLVLIKIVSVEHDARWVGSGLVSGSHNNLVVGPSPLPFIRGNPCRRPPVTTLFLKLLTAEQYGACDVNQHQTSSLILISLIFMWAIPNQPMY